MYGIRILQTNLSDRARGSSPVLGMTHVRDGHTAEYEVT